MTLREWIVMFLVGGVLGAAPALAQEDTRRALARELARLTINDSVQRGVDEQIGTSLVQALAATLQGQLSRRLLDSERGLLTEIVGRFIHETLPPKRTEEIAAEIYLRYFDERELRELVAFQRSAVGRKAAGLTRVIASDTLHAIDDEIRTSPAIPDMLAELQRAFPVLGTFQSP